MQQASKRHERLFPDGTKLHLAHTNFPYDFVLSTGEENYGTGHTIYGSVKKGKAAS
jgi:hypothetical protein